MTPGLPELRTPGLTRVVLDVPVEEGPVAVPEGAPVADPPQLWADERQLLFRVEDAAVQVTADSVRIEATDDAARAAADWLLYSTATRAMLCFRDRFNLHATLAVSPRGAAVAIVGDATAGKSTTAIELVRRGWTLACDDIVEVALVGDDAEARPVRRPVHLSAQAVALLGGDPAVGRPIPFAGKRAYAIEGDLTPRRLSALVVLSKLAEGPAVEARRVDGMAAIPTLARSSDRYRICRLPSRRAAFHRWSTGLCRRTPVWDVRRPADLATVDRVADAVAELAASAP